MERPDHYKDDITSRWPLPSAGIRFLVPQFLTELLSRHPLSQDLHPIAAGYYPCARNHRMQRRKHSNNLLIYCSEGRGHLQLEDQHWPVQAGDLIVLPAGRPHTYRADIDQPWSIYWVHYQGSLSPAYTEFLHASQPVLQIGPQPRLIAEFEALFALRQAGFVVDRYIYASCRLKAMLADLSIVIARRPATGARELDLDQVRELMQQHLETDLNLDQLSTAVNMSKYHFSRKFKALTGHSPIQHFIHLKMQYACQLLDRSDEPIKRIAAQLGYEDAYYFSRLFKRVLGVSPQHYREHRSA